MSANKEKIHLKGIPRKISKRWNSFYTTTAYCNRSWHNLVKVEIKLFLLALEEEPDVVCKLCRKRVIKEGLDKNPEKYKALIGLKLLQQQKE